MQITGSSETLGRKIKSQIIFWMWVRQRKPASLLRAYMSAVRQPEITSVSGHICNEVGRCPFGHWTGRPESLVSGHFSSETYRSLFCQRTFQHWGRPEFLLSEEQAKVTSGRGHFGSETGKSHFCQRTFQQWSRQESLLSEISGVR
jgi:hypothetical protein